MAKRTYDKYLTAGAGIGGCWLLFFSKTRAIFNTDTSVANKEGAHKLMRSFIKKRIKRFKDPPTKCNPNNIKDFWIPFLSIVVAIISILSNVFMQTWISYRQDELKKFELNKQFQLKQYEITFNERKVLYINFMQHFDNSFHDAYWGERRDFSDNYEKLKTTTRSMEPYFGKDEFNSIERKLHDYWAFCTVTIISREKRENINIQSVYTEYYSYQNFFRNILYAELVGKKPKTE